MEIAREEHPPQPDTEKRFIFPMLLAYAMVEIAGMLSHPMWRDEIHPWVMAGTSSSLSDLLQRKAIEGHPDLWYILVYVVRSLSGNPLSLQLVHSGMAILTVFLILKYAPFSRVQRGLLVFGYFFLFEYAMISRNYAIGILLVTLFLIMYRERSRFLLLMAFILFFLAQTNVYGLIFSIVLTMTLLFEFTFSDEFRRDMHGKITTMMICILIIVAGISYSVHSIIPPPSAYFAGSSHFSFSQLTLKETIRSIATVWESWVPIPKNTAQFWNTNFVRYYEIESVFSIMLMVSAGLIFIRRPVVFFLFVTGLAGIIAFILMYYYGYIRHHGHLYILLICCMWMKEFYRESNLTFRLDFINRYYDWLKRNLSRLFLILLSVHVLVGIFAMYVQFRIPFSAARLASGYIRQNNLDRFLIAGDQDVSLETISGYLNKEVFYFSRNAFGTYLIYDEVRKIPDMSTVIAMADSLSKANGDTILLVMNTPMEEHPGLNLKKLRSFEESIRWDEKYYLYLLKPTEKNTNPSSPEKRTTFNHITK